MSSWLIASLGIALSIPGLFLLQLVFGLGLYFGLSWLSFRYFFVWRKERFFHGEPEVARRDVHAAMRLGFWNVLGNALLGTPFQYWILHGRGRLYYRVSDHGWRYLLSSALLFFFVTELFVYWEHRLLHHRVLYKHLHLFHHKFRQPTPWVSMAFHPLDSWLQALPYYLCALFIPVHASVYAALFGFVMVWTFLIHDRVSIVRVPIIHYTAHHTIHHVYNKHNYGQFTTLFDRLFGTHRDPAVETHFTVMYPPTPAPTDSQLELS